MGNVAGIHNAPEQTITRRNSRIPRNGKIDDDETPLFANMGGQNAKNIFTACLGEVKQSQTLCASTLNMNCMQCFLPNIYFFVLLF